MQRAERPRWSLELCGVAVECIEVDDAGDVAACGVSDADDGVHGLKHSAIGNAKRLVGRLDRELVATVLGDVGRGS